MTIIYISHIFEETFALADRITVMRDGRYIHTLETSKTSKAELIKLMVGRDISDSFPMRNTALGDVVLKVENVTAPGVEDISFDLRRGEILGFAGLVGAGRTELMNAIYGASEKSKGTITILRRSSATSCGLRPLRFPSWPKISAEEISKRWRLQRHWRPIRKS